MNLNGATKREQALIRFAKFGLLLTIVVALSVVCGWVFQIGWLKGIAPGWATMKFNTAFCFFLSGLSLGLFVRKKAGFRIFSRVVALVVFVISFLTAVQYVLQYSFGIDQVFFADSESKVYPGRMSLGTSISFVFLTLSLFFLTSEKKEIQGRVNALLILISPIFSLIVFFAGLMAIAGYLYNVKGLYSFIPFSSMALHTAMLLILMSMSSLSVSASSSPFQILVSDGLGSSMLRKMLPFAIISSLLICWLGLLGVTSGVYSSEMGFALVATLNVLVYSIWITIGSVSLNRTDAAHRKMDKSYKEVEKEKSLALEMSRLKSEFLAKMSHELRTPLNAIIGFGELLADGKIGPVNEKQQEFLGDIQQKGQHLLQIVNDILEFTKLESNKVTLHPERFALSPLIDEIVESMAPVLTEKELRFKIEIQKDLQEVYFDVGKIRQILYNLISNAVKFSDEKGLIQIHITSNLNEMILVVADEGIGIKEEEIPRLFKAFEQLDSSHTRQYGGTGLGLALTKSLIDLHEGRIDVKSEPDQGTTFQVFLPFPKD